MVQYDCQLKCLENIYSEQVAFAKIAEGKESVIYYLDNIEEYVSGLNTMNWELCGFFRWQE